MKRDPGVQPERTALAWRRTAFAVLVNGALLLRAAANAHAASLWMAALLVVTAGLAIFGVARRREDELRSAPPHASPRATQVRLVLGAVWLACAAAAMTLAATRT